MTYIFLSYAKADRDTAFEIRDVLKKEGFRVWMDENKRELSIVYWPQIQKNINDSGLFVVLLSDAAQKSAWLKRELDYAEKVKKPIRAFVIQGEGWERLNNYVTPLSLGLRLDVPQQAAKEIKTVLQESPDKPIPLQIPSDTISKYTVWSIIAFCVIVSALVLINRFAPMVQDFMPMAQDFIQNSLNPPSPAPMTTRQVLEATSAASILTRSYETSEANARNTSVAAVATADARGTYQAEMNQTAIVRGGVLPCGASPIEQEDLTRLEFYRSPDPDDFSRLIRISDFEYLVLTEWVRSYNIIWYRAESEDGRVYGYIQEEWLVLDEDCPR